MDEVLYLIAIIAGVSAIGIARWLLVRKRQLIREGDDQDRNDDEG